ncbi:GldG family protein [Acetivibrio clariflavus]|uniref:ABC-type uncharacterized transporter n=1 Tax=Acetivibrio clariflavus (strain DSM 19732 / NBRC 101661 / EBR45) TaxID=720554 RepID=G8LUK8_ACECE|nr:GldG family protein [Acetivibrio clariflavus]AEV67348.1 ABC-type uncharacterized transporter [Acetivibrio clariflavus DSM 19732]HOQ00307.1 GldG family protein [Acetivibrio clariflavus]
MKSIVDKIKSIFSNKNFKYGSLFMVLSIFLIAVTVIINMIAEIDKLNVRWDLTPNKMYSIGDETKKILNELQQDVEIIFLSDRKKLEEIEGAGEMITEFLDNYDAYPKVTVKYIDPDKNPRIIKELDKEDMLGLKTDNIVVKSGNKVKKVVANELFYSDYYSNTPYFAAEQSITGAIKYVTSEKTPVVYFIEGHNERGLESEYSGLKQILENGNYIVKTLNLTVESKVPDDAEMLIFAAPKRDLSKAEAERLLDYLKSDGNAIFLFEPVFSDKRFDNFENVLNEYNISINYDRIQENDPSRHYPDDPYTFLPTVQTSEITGGEDLSDFYVLFNDSRSFSILNNYKEPLRVFPLLTSSEKAIGESYGMDEEDSMGPHFMGLAAEYNSAYKSKVLVYGNAYVFTDDGFSQFAPLSENTMKFFLASIAWMRDTTNDLVIAPKTNMYDIMNLSSRNTKLVILVTVLVVPLLIIIIGVIVWLRRKRL